MQVDKIKGPLLHKHKAADVKGLNLTYTNLNPMPEKVGGHEAGSTFDKVPYDKLITDHLYPYQSPELSGFGITGQPQLVEVGVNLSGNKSFTWNHSNAGNILPNTGIIREIISYSEIANAIDLLLPSLVVPGMVIPNIIPISKNYRIEGINSKNQKFWSNSFILSSVYPVYSGKVNSPGATPMRPIAAQELLYDSTKAVIQSNGDVTLSFNSVSDDYIWFAIPTTSQLFTKWFITALNTGNISGAVSIGGNLFPNPDTISLTSLQGLWENIPYRVYVSNYRTSVASITFKRA
jgi:hypothetical protein